ncbi:N-acetyltransferase Sli1p [[Candida] anglica]|uniref:N-acetyltransferase Sli1p n=1 Tax=[Candida] anglica TaxID=148631 RepID=A0ABP0EKD2_9ASCO
MTIISRPLSVVENFFRSRTAVGYYTNFQLTATYSEKISLELLGKALRKTLIDYHILACNIQKGTEYCSYEPIEEIYLNDIVESQINDEISEEFLKKVSDIQFQLYTNKPLFKVILLGNFKICAIFEHSIADGIAGVHFHEILIENFDFIQRNPIEFEQEYGWVGINSPIFNLNQDQDKIKYSLPPPVDYFLEHYNVDYSNNDPNHYSKITPPGYEKWKGRFPSCREFSSAFKLVNISPIKINQILQKCKKEGVTLTAFIEVVEALTLQPVFGDSCYTSHKVAMNLRRHLSVEGDLGKHLENYPNHKVLGTMAHMGLSENFPPIKEFSWDLVRSVNSNILQSVANKKVLNVSKAFNDIASPIDDNKEIFTSQAGKTRPDAIKISNLGFVQASSGNWNITDVVFSQDLAVIAADFMLNIVSTKAGGLNFVLSFIDNPELELTDVANTLKDNLLKFALE